MLQQTESQDTSQSYGTNALDSEIQSPHVEHQLK